MTIVWWLRVLATSVAEGFIAAGWHHTGLSEPPTCLERPPHPSIRRAVTRGLAAIEDEMQAAGWRR